MGLAGVGAANHGIGNTATVDRPKPELSPSVQNNTQVNNSKNASPPVKHSFFGYLYEDVVKTLWKILSGATISEIQKNVLKDSKFTLNMVIDKVFRRDFVSRFGADLTGAWAVRLFNGKTKILGIPLPKLHSSISSQLGPTTFVKFWRALSTSDDLNGMSADKDKRPFAKELREDLKDRTWVKWMDTMSNIYQNQVSPVLTKVFSTVFGIRAGAKDENGKESEPDILWGRFLSVAGISGVLAWMLPKGTQVFGMEGIGESKGFWKSVGASVFTFVVTTLSRLENYLFANSLSLHQRGYGFEGVMKVAIRDKMLTPIVQIASDVVSANLSKLLPLNGAFISSLIRLPAELVAGYMSAGLTGIADETRVPENWTHLSNSIWKPVANLFEKVFLDFKFMPPYQFPLKHIYKFLGFYPAKYDGQYYEPKAREVSPELEAKFAQESLTSVFWKSLKGMPGDLKKLLDQSMGDKKLNFSFF